MKSVLTLLLLITCLLSSCSDISEENMGDGSTGADITTSPEGELSGDIIETEEETTEAETLPEAILSEEDDLMIREAYIAEYNRKNATDHTADEIRIKRYFGEYNGSFALYLDPFSITMHETRKEEIAGISFNYPDSRNIKVYNNGNFYILKDAFEKGIITKDDLIIIRQMHKQAFPASYK